MAAKRSNIAAESEVLLRTLYPLEMKGAYGVLPVEPVSQKASERAFLQFCQALSVSLCSRILAVILDLSLQKDCIQEKNLTEYSLDNILNGPTDAIHEMAKPASESVDQLRCAMNDGSITAASYNLDGCASAIDRFRQAYSHSFSLLPPAHSLPAMTRFARLFDGVILTLSCEYTRWEVAQEMLEILKKGDVHICGTVLNNRRLYLPKWLYRRI